MDSKVIIQKTKINELKIKKERNKEKKNTSNTELKDLKTIFFRKSKVSVELWNFQMLSLVP